MLKKTTAYFGKNDGYNGIVWLQEDFPGHLFVGGYRGYYGGVDLYADDAPQQLAALFEKDEADGILYACEGINGDVEGAFLTTNGFNPDPCDELVEIFSHMEEDWKEYIYDDDEEED